jgi:ABC-type phosphate/phosphonate transport system substrate-binding protein
VLGDVDAATACSNAAGDAEVTTTAPPVVGIVKATVTIPADAAAASNTSDCDLTSATDVADWVCRGDCAPSEL